MAHRASTGVTPETRRSAECDVTRIAGLILCWMVLLSAGIAAQPGGDVLEAGSWFFESQRPEIAPSFWRDADVRFEGHETLALGGSLHNAAIPFRKHRTTPLRNIMGTAPVLYKATR